MVINVRVSIDSIADRLCAPLLLFRRHLPPMIADTHSGYIGGSTCRQIALNFITAPCRNGGLSPRNLLPPIVASRLTFKGRPSPVQQRDGRFESDRTWLLLFDKRLKVGFRLAASD